MFYRAIIVWWAELIYVRQTYTYLMYVKLLVDKFNHVHKTLSAIFQLKVLH